MSITIIRRHRQEQFAEARLMHPSASLRHRAAWLVKAAHRECDRIVAATCRPFEE